MMRNPNQARLKHSIPYFLECDACNKNIKSASHYCYDCKAIFCDSCVIKEKVEVTVCSDCGWNLFGTDPKTGELYCKHCKDDGKESDGHQLVSVQKDKQVCPKCHSSNTIEIDDLKTDLKDHYKNIVLDSRNILKDFNNFINFLSLVKQKLLKIRLEHPVMLHEPTLERDILSVMEESGLIERRIMNRVHSFFLLLQSKRDYFLGSRPWCNDDISVLETYITQLQSDFVSFMAQIAESFNQPLDMLQTTKDRVEYIANIRDFFVGFMNKGIINFEKGEFPIVNVEDAKLDSDDEQSGHGHILVTNKSFKFIKSTGYLRKTDALLFSFPLDKLLSSGIIGRVFKALNFQFQGINLKFHVEKQRMQPLINYIDQAAKFDQSALDEDAIRKIRDFDVNSIFKIKSHIEDNINNLLNPSASATYQPQPAAKPNDQEYKNSTLVFNRPVQPSSNQGSSVFDEALDFDMTGMNGYTPQDNQDGFPRDGMACMHQAKGFLPSSPAISTGDFRNYLQGAEPDDSWLPRPPVPESPMQSQGFVGQPRQAPWNQANDCGSQYQPPPMQGSMSMHPQVQAMLHTHELEQRMQRTNQTKYLVAVMRTCEQKQIAIHETMKNLDYKFELGKIAPNVYFQTHTLFAERLVALEQEIQDIKTQLTQNQAALTRATHY